MNSLTLSTRSDQKEICRLSIWFPGPRVSEVNISVLFSYKNPRGLALALKSANHWHALYPRQTRDTRVIASFTLVRWTNTVKVDCWVALQISYCNYVINSNLIEENIEHLQKWHFPPSLPTPSILCLVMYAEISWGFFSSLKRRSAKITKQQIMRPNPTKDQLDSLPHSASTLFEFYRTASAY